MFNPERVDLARLRLGLTKVAFAKELDIDRKALHRFESGNYDLPEKAQKLLLQVSGFSEEFFKKAAPEYPNPEAVSFRSLRSLTASARNAAVAVSALAFEFDDFVLSRYQLPEHDLVPEKGVSPSKAALTLRAQWGIGVRPIGNMLNMMEAHGIRVFTLAEETRHLDAYSFWRNDRPYIFLNTLKSAERSRFDAAHELGHLILHRHTGSAHINAEAEADAFAATFLMPKEDLVAEVPVVRSLKTIISAKRRWGVSAAALAYTLHKLGRITDWHYRGYCIELGKLGRDVEPNPMPRETSQIWSKVLTDLWRQGMSLSRLAEKLAIPEKELNSLLFGIASELPSSQQLAARRASIVQ
jgi:Zn-dependent peptidase ImmA (M78 family)